MGENVTRPKTAAFMVVGDKYAGRELLPGLRMTWHQSSTCSQLNVSGFFMLQVQRLCYVCPLPEPELSGTHCKASVLYLGQGLCEGQPTPIHTE